MTNLLNGAHVANKLFSTIARLRLLLVILTMFVLSIGQMYGYTITFNGSANESTSLSTSTTAASITGNSTYVTGNLVTATKVYGATSNGVKLGTSSNAGTIKFNLSTTGQVTPTSIVVNCKLYSSSKSATLKVNGSATQNVPSSSGNLTFAITSPITYIELVSSKYIWIKSVTVNTAAGYKVTYDKNGATSGSVPTDNTSYTSGATVTVKSNTGNLAKTGYTFGGWNTNSSGTGTNYTAGSGTFKITANTTLYAKWNTATKYTVTLSAGPGTCAASVTEAYAGAGVTLPTPTLDGCGEWSFAGWKTTSAVTTETTTEPTLIAAGAYSPTSDITLYAVYQRTETTSGGGEASLTKMVAGNTLSNGDKIVVVANETSTAMYQETINSSYVNKWDCSTLTADVVADDDKNWWIVTMTDGGFHLGDATNGYLNMSSNNLYCNADKSVWTLLDLEDGTFKLQSNGRNLSYRSDLNTNPYWRMGGASYGTSGQTILNLYKYTSGGGGSTTYYHSTPDCGSAEPTVSTYTVKHYQQNLDGTYPTTPTNTETPSGEVGAIVTPAVKSYEGFTAPTAKSVEITADGNAVVEYQYTRNSYTLTWNVNGGNALTGDYTNGSVKYGATISKPIDPTREGYRFSGWNNGTSIVTPATTMPANNLTYTAQWTPIYTITWLANGHEHHSQTNVEGTAIEIPAEPEAATYACDDKVFVGWVGASIDGSTNEEPDFITDFGNVKENKTYYAVFATPSGNGFTLGQSGDFKIYANVEGNNIYAATYNNGKFTSTNEDISAVTFKFTHKENNQYTIYNGSKYVAYGTEGTDLELQSDEYLWTIAPATNEKGSWRVTSVQYPSRAIIYRTGYDFKAYGTTNITTNGYYDIEIGGATTYTEYVTSCVTCENVLTIIKGNEENGTFILSPSGEIKTCDGDLVVTVSEISPAEHHSVASVTATTPTTGDAPTVTNNGNGNWTVTYNQNSTGESTINVTFVQDAKASITLSELGVTSTINTYSVGDQYTLPSTSSQSCDGKQLVGWSTVEVAETNTKPTSNYYELGAKVTLAATQTFFAVFATANGEGDSGSGYRYIGDETLLTIGKKYIFVSTNTAGNAFALKASDLAYTGTGTKGTAVAVTVTSVSEEMLVATENTDLEFEAVELDEDYTLRVVSDDTKYLYINGSGIGYRDESRSYYDETGLYGWNNKGDKWYDVYYDDASSQKFIQQEDATSRVYAYEKQATTTYTAYTTSCVPTYSITYDFAGGIGSHCSNTSVPQGDSYTICDEAPTKEGHTFLGWSDGINTYQPNNSFTPTSDITLTAQWQVNTYIVTWNNNGVTTPIEYNHGETLEVPATPASCDGVKEFVGWTTHSGYYHATTAPDDIFTTKTTPVSATATYYAVFATPPTTGGGGSIETTDDVLTRETTGITDGTTTYSAWSGIKVTSSAVYAGNSAGSNNAIQLRSNNSNSGIVTTTSGGKVTRVEVEWQSATADNRTLDIYGRNVAYSAATELYSTSTQGTKLGSIICGTSTELEITDDYEYIGLRSNSGAMYLTSVTITWSSAGGSSSHTDYTTICQEVTGIAISGSYPTTFVQYDSFSFAGGIVTATFENGATQDVTSLATFSGYNMDEVGVQTVTVTYMGQTAKYEITINQSDRWRLTWNVSGKTNTGARPIYVQKGSAIGTLPVPEVPAACAGKTFMGWTESNIVPSDGKGIVYITEETVPTKNTTYYAVFATINNFSTQAAIEDIKTGSKVVIVAVASMDASGGAGQAISSRTISITSQGVIGLSGDEVSIFDETINTPHSTCIWTLTKEGGGIVFEQGGKYIRAVDGGYRKLLLETTKDYWTLSPVTGKDKTYHMQSGNTSHYVEWFDHTDSKYDEGERYIGFVPYTEANDNGDFDMQFYVTANADGNADITDYTTGCEEYTITYYGFRGGYSTSTSSDGTIVLPVNSTHTIPNCEGLVINDHTNLGREFLNVWMTQPHGGHTFEPGDTFILTQDTTLYAQWKMETTSDVTTLPTDIEDLAGTDIYVYGGKTLNIQPGTTTINSLTLKGGLQADGSYKMPTVWVPEGATLVRNSNKIYLDLVVNAKNYYPFAVPFRAKNGSAKANWDYVGYINPVLKEAATYRTHFVIKTYDGAKRADKGENRDANWAIVNRDTYLEPGVGYMITAMTYAGEDTVTMRIPMSVSNTWFKNGEQAEVGTTVRNTIAVTAHAGAAATEHQRHAGWNFVANPYLTSFTGGNVVNDDGLAYINGELIIEGSYEYTDEDVPYVTVPAYDFAYYSQHKLSDVKLSPEWSFFVQVGTDGTMNFTTAGRQQAPAHLAARAAEQPIKMDVDITLSDDNHSDQTGLIICDRFSDAYEIGHDLEKMFGSAYNLSVYTLMADNTPLAFQALAIQNSMQVIPVGYRTPAQGEYTFALNEATSDIELLNEQYEQLILVDYETGALTNMLNNEYTFYSDRTQSNNRFALYAVLRQNTTTDLPNTIGNEEVKKVIYNDHFYILRDGKVFNGAGQIVK